jgi:N-acetylmuramoyl-L-alanine amidase
MTPRIRDRHLPYVGSLEPRALSAVDLVVIHCTELPDLATARQYGKRVHYTATRTGNSGHFYVDRDGQIEEWVPIGRVAHHVRGFNARSIGIELVNRGRYPDWYHSERQDMREPYPEAQIDALTGLLTGLRERLPVLRWIAGHEALDRERIPASDRPEITVLRKTDPGPRFPWSVVLARSGLQAFQPDPEAQPGARAP